MGDYLSPKRRDLLDKLRRRMEGYKRHHNGVQQRFIYGHKSIYEQERQHSLLLRQKVLDSKAAKKASKSKSKSDSGGSDHRSQLVTKKLKHKLDSNSAENQQQIQQHAARVYSFDDDDGGGPTPAKTQCTSNTSTSIDGAISSSVSVHIVHQINGSNAQTDSKISTNVTVNQTISQSDSAETDVQTNVECKSEPNDDIVQNSADRLDDKDADIEDILKAAAAENVPISLIDELNKFDEILTNISGQETDGNDSGLKSGDNMFASDMSYLDPSQTQGQPYRVPQGGQHAAPSAAMSEVGQAAEALKRMANQHQQHQPPEQFGVKSAADPFSDMSETGNFSTRNGYPQDYLYYSGANSGMQNRSGSTDGYPGHSGPGYPNKQALPGYGSQNNKQLAPYTHQTPTSQSETGPSSLQQLQNQVAHFNHAPQMEITQTQHMQVSDGSHRMQMSQTQQIQLRQPPFPTNISLTQQQGFSAAAAASNLGGAPPAAQNATSQSQTFMGDQMTLQQQQMMQSKMQHPDQRQAHMQQYMNRPPPEYKMQNGMASGMGASANNMGTNPLQTIQNMVNQTNTHQNQTYSSVKSESSEIQNGMRTAQMQQQQMGMASQAQYSYSNQSMQRQGSFPGTMSHQMAGRPQRQNTPTYTSAIMRNQRPPNVNIGPDGLNISQPRHPQEWAARGMNPMTAQGPRPGVPSSSANMMHYRSFQGPDGGHSATAAQMQMHQRSMHMDPMQSQQAAMMQQQQSSAHVQQQQMMLQQQRIQMSQQMSQQQQSQVQHSRQTPPYSMPTQQTAAGASYPQSNSTQDDILNLLDTAPNQTTDFFDVQTSGGGAEANWCDIEDILGKT